MTTNRKLDAATLVEVKKRLRSWQNSITAPSNVDTAARELNAPSYLGKQAAEAIASVLETVQIKLDEMLDEAMNSTVFMERG